MPASRRQKMRCAYADPYEAPVKAKKPRAPPKKLTPEEKEEKQKLAAEKKAHAAKKKEWETALTPWVVDKDVRFSIGTLAMFKSDAKAAYGLTEKDILSIRHECIPNSLKTFFACADVGALALRKQKFFDPTFEMPAKDSKKQLSPGLIDAPRCLFKKTADDNRRRKANFHSCSVFSQLVQETGNKEYSLFMGGRAEFAM
ncbi:hypothetical protein FA95DRAFT_1554571 [Auriscalpium vulgare]|uniref:Uncharacterized protein n=1 Tax=Auriscalpium vulgare TaxID=40419 RepID=A0ACB8S5H6_9AGAM|nr:hypothetical protein FA95DRAFT_1554571 [Auriscalpium vulgare]